jgi:phosphoribosylformylglycinamidine (FGAM) synthase-like enzyme
VDLAAEKALAELLVDGVGLLTSAHDLSDGGLAQTLVESVLRHDVGVITTVAGDAFVALFAESAGRVVVTIDVADADELAELAAKYGVVATPLGVDGEFAIPLAELRTAWSATLPAALG